MITAVVLVAYVLFVQGPSSYTVKARFLNAGQLVKGNLVEVGGIQAGSVKNFEITADGQVEVELEIDDKYAPLREGTRGASIRQDSLSSVANRYIELHLPGENEAGDDIPDGGLIDRRQDDHRRRARPVLQHARQATPARRCSDFYARQQPRVRRPRRARPTRGLRYLSPSLDASSRPVRGARLRPAGARAFLVDSLALRHRAGRAPRRPGAR